MKEATGELSTTVITIVAIGLVIAIFTAFLLPTLRAQIALSQACSGGPGYETSPEGGGYVVCGNLTGSAPKCNSKNAKGTYVQKGSKQCNANEQGTATQKFTCVYCRENK